MKNNNDHDIKRARAAKLYKAAAMDIIVNPDLVRSNQQRLAGQLKRRRRRDYAKKIMNDPFIMSV